MQSINKGYVIEGSDIQVLLITTVDGMIVQLPCSGCITDPTGEIAEYFKLTTDRQPKYECNLDAVTADRQKWQGYADRYPESSYTPAALYQVIFLYFYPTQCDITKEQKYLFQLAAAEVYKDLIKRFPKSDEAQKAKWCLDNMTQD